MINYYKACNRRMERNIIMEKTNEQNTYVLQEDEDLGTVKIADDVVAMIAGLAATEVDGVAAMAGNITNELVGKLGMKNLSKGVKVDVLENVVCVNLNLNLEYGYSIPETCKKVQEKVKTAIENIVKDKLNIENNVLNNDINPEEYYHQRLIQLTQKISELIDVCQEEFRKDSEYENKISELENINSQILNSNSWKATEKLRKIKRKFK